MTPLSLIDKGSTVKIIKINGGKQVHKRLIMLGITEGREIEIINNNFGHLVIKSGNSNIILGRGISNKIIVL